MPRKAKLELGCKVRLNARAPQFVKEELRQRTRTVVGVYPDSNDRCCYYELGERGKGKLPYMMRSYQLTLVSAEKQHNIGRPKTKRKYTRRATCQ